MDKASSRICRSDNVKRMPPRVRVWLILLAMLVPSAQFAWRNRTMPQFGSLHDDGVLFVSAKSLAQTGTYSIPSLPENPRQTKFPLLYPLFLSLAWRMNSHFPDNLQIATWMSWLVLAACLGLAWAFYRRQGLSDGRAGLMMIVLGLNPYWILFGCSLFSEVFFTCWLLAALLAAARPGVRIALLAGALAGLAYLSRTAGIALLVSVPLLMAWRREWRRVGAFLAAMLPAVLGWMAWTRLHMPQSADTTLVYYTDYIRYQFLNVGFDNLAVVVWKNVDQVLYGMGSLALPKVVDLLPVKILTQVIGVAMISGTVRLARRGIALEYALFGLISVAILFVWHFPPNERFVLPLYPLLLAGLFAEMEHIGQMLKAAFRHKDFGQRAVAGMMAAGVATVFGAAALLQVYVTFVYLAESSAQKAAKLIDQRAGYAWISANLPRSAGILSYDDPLLYLYTSNRGNYLPLLPRWWYSQDHAAMVGAYRNLAAYCRGRGLEYVYFTSSDLERETSDEDRQEIQKVVRGNAELVPVFNSGIGTIYKVASILKERR